MINFIEDNMRKTISLFIAALLLSGCSKQPNNLVLPTRQETQSVVQTTAEDITTTEDIFATEEETSLELSSEDITSVESSTESSSRSVETTRPKKDRWAALETSTDASQSLEGQTYEETTEYYQLETTAAPTTEIPIYTEPETTIANTQPAQKVEGWGNGNFEGMDSVELPSFYRSRGSVAYVDKTVVPDSNIFEKDAYGNYIIPMLFLKNAEQYKKALPYNNYGKIPYCYAYDSGGTILNPLPKEYEEFRSMFMIGQSEDYNNRPVNYTQPAFKED